MKLAIQFYQIPVTVTNDLEIASVISQLSMSGVWTQIDKFLFLGSYKNMVTVNGLYPQLRAHWEEPTFKFELLVEPISLWPYDYKSWHLLAGGWRLSGPRDRSVVPCPVGFFNAAMGFTELTGGICSRLLKEPLRQYGRTWQWCSIFAPTVKTRHRFCPRSTEKGLHKGVTPGDGNHWVSS